MTSATLLHPIELADAELDAVAAGGTSGGCCGSESTTVNYNENEFSQRGLLNVAVLSGDQVASGNQIIL